MAGAQGYNSIHLRMDSCFRRNDMILDKDVNVKIADYRNGPPPQSGTIADGWGTKLIL